MMDWILTILVAQASHYDAESGIYIGPSRKTSEDESILANLSLTTLNTGQSRKESLTSPLIVDPHSGIHSHISHLTHPGPR